MWTHISDTDTRGQRDYICTLCGLRIRKRAKHVVRRGFTEDGPESFRMHPVCEAKTRDWREMDWECADDNNFRFYDLGLPLLERDVHSPNGSRTSEAAY